MPVKFGMDSLVLHMVSQHFATGIVAPTPTNAKCTALPQMERKESCFHVTTFVKLRSCRVRMPVDAAVDSLVRHLTSHHFATESVAPTPTTDFSTTIKGTANMA